MVVNGCGGVFDCFGEVSGVFFDFYSVLVILFGVCRKVL